MKEELEELREKSFNGHSIVIRWSFNSHSVGGSAEAGFVQSKKDYPIYLELVLVHPFESW